MTCSLHRLLKQYWGFSVFRPLQEEIMQSVLAGHDTLALLPTGGGKSLCFQIPALLNPGICIVVSPLIALMKDQVEALKTKNIAAVAIMAGMNKHEVDRILDNCLFGDIKFLYISPERLLSDLVRTRISHMKVNLMAIDEAHCISQWGYDFRPSYLQLTQLRVLHPDIPVLALTATATPRVILDIQKQLAFKKECVFRKSFERKNLTYVVLQEENKLGKLLEIIQKVPGSGLVYVRNRRKTEEIARYLKANHISSACYHAGLDKAWRMQKQDAWKNGEVRIMVATNAFGMGIDKSDVRFVIHMDLPESLEAYYQEAGRSGRDEKKAYAVLLYNESDKLQLLKRLAQNFPAVEEIKQIYHHLGNYYQLAYGAGAGLALDFDLADFCVRFKLEANKVIHALKFLERDAYIQLNDSVSLSSRVQFITHATALYQFQVAQPAYDGLIKTLLRAYGGLFDHLVPIKENDIATQIGLSKAAVIAQLHQLQSMKVLDYLPQTDQPQLQWMRPRVSIAQVLIDRKFIAERHHIYRHQTKSVITYAEKTLCRSMQLLHYLDDLEASPCGLCDVCLKKKKADAQASISNQMCEALLLLLASGKKSIQELVSGLEHGREQEKLEHIRLLLDAGEIKSDGWMYYL